jgi:hypothetical protein
LSDVREALKLNPELDAAKELLIQVESKISRQKRWNCWAKLSLK